MSNQLPPNREQPEILFQILPVESWEPASNGFRRRSQIQAEAHQLVNQLKILALDNDREEFWGLLHGLAVRAVQARETIKGLEMELAGAREAWQKGWTERANGRRMAEKWP